MYSICIIIYSIIIYSIIIVININSIIIIKKTSTYNVSFLLSSAPRNCLMSTFLLFYFPTFRISVTMYQHHYLHNGYMAFLQYGA